MWLRITAVIHTVVNPAPNLAVFGGAVDRRARSKHFNPENRSDVNNVTALLPGRIDPATTTFASANDLASAMRRSAAAHAEHEKRGRRDQNWQDWYAAYMAAERQGPSCLCERLSACSW
jgi:hypothetical protein